jgi:dihydrofolate reductase
MQKVRVGNFSVSIEGFGAGTNQDINNPLGIGGIALHQWFFATDVFQEMHDGKQGEKGVDNDFALKAFENIGSYVMGRNMFGPIRGNWMDENWRGWWGENPPFHCPVYVLTNHPRESIIMEGGTVFHFVTSGIDEALQRAKQSAEGRNVQIGGGVKTIQQYLAARLIDEMHLAISPILLGSGERLLQNIDLVKLGYRCVSNMGTEKATHVLITKVN